MIGKLKEVLGETVRENELLARHTNFRIGGPARYFFEARSSDEIVRAVQVAGMFGLPYYILGGGSNVLVADGGFEGLVIKAANRCVELSPSPQPSPLEGEGERIDFPSLDGRGKGRVFAEAGVLSAFLARKTAEAGLTGFEWAISLPGTIGGAIFGNAGCFGGEMKDVVKSVEVFDPQKTTNYKLQTTNCGFDYRDSVFKRTDPKIIILSVELELKKDDPAVCLARLEEKLHARKARQPLESSSAGCLFKNFEFHDQNEIAKLESKIKVPEEFVAAGRIPAGWIIDQLGLKGMRIGDAMISEKHGNFVLNLGQATADHVIQLTAFVKTRARNELGIQLQEEVQYVGL